jgi:hypothetical protein
VEVLVLPTQAAQCISPLGNTLFHAWKETLVTSMADEEYNTKQENIEQHHDYCASTGEQHVY